MTPAEIITLLRAHPAAAIEAVKGAKVAGPRGWFGPLDKPYTSSRTTLDGQAIGRITNERDQVMGWFAVDGRPQPRLAKGETPQQFAARVDAALLADGWVFAEGPC